jgi:hypothetical protein
MGVEFPVQENPATSEKTVKPVNLFSSVLKTAGAIRRRLGAIGGIRHPQLGLLVPHKRLPQWFGGHLKYDGRDISLSLSEGDGTLDQAFALAIKIVGSLPEIDRKAKEAIAKDLLETYNDSWNGHDRQLEDGTWAVFSNSPLTAEEFVGKMTLANLYVGGDDEVILSYDDGELFLGHGVSATSLEGSDFSKATAELYG